MQRIGLAKDLELSRIVYGMWRIGDDDDTSAAHIQAKIETCLAHGITSMDQADIYGGYTAEALLGATLSAAPHLRDQIEIITKCDIVAPIGKYANARVKYYDTSRAHILNSVDSSLKNMGIDYIDLLLIHRPDPLMDHRETGSALDDIVASGKVRQVGVSNFKPYDVSLLQSAMANRLVTNQIEISVMTHLPFTNGDVAYLQEKSIPPMAWSPLGGGGLFGSDYKDLQKSLDVIAERLECDLATLAISWLLRHPSRILPVIGTNRIDRIAGLAGAMSLEIDRETWFEIYTAALGHEVA